MKRAIIFATFGSADEMIRRNIIDAAVDEIHESSDCEVRLAFTSNFMRRKLQLQGEEMPDIAEQVESLRLSGFDNIIILPSHLTPGEEFEYKILPFEADDVQVLTPLFSAQCNTNFDLHAFKTIIDCFKPAKEEQLILIGHGSPHRHNPVYENLQKLADVQNINVHIGVIEPNDTPNFDDVIHRLKKFNALKVFLAPMLFNGGVHVNNDIAGNDKNSWKSRLINAGYQVRLCNNGLGSFKNFRQLFIDKLRL